MKKTILFLMIGAGFLASCKHHGKGAANAGAEGTASVSNVSDPVKAERIAHNQRVLETARKMHDSYTELNALCNIMADDTTDNLKNMDSLAEIYQTLNMGLPALKMAEKILEKDPNNEKMLELKAEGDMGMGKDEDALNVSRKLYDKTKNIKYLFNIANVQMQQGNEKDVDETLEKIKSSPSYQKDSIDVPDNQTGNLQKVPAPALMSYVEAMLKYKNKDINGMYKKLKEALNIFPDYVNANKAIQAIIQQSQQAAPGHQ